MHGDYKTWIMLRFCNYSPTLHAESPHAQKCSFSETHEDTQTIDIIDYGIYVHHVRSFQSQLLVYSIYAQTQLNLL